MTDVTNLDLEKQVNLLLDELISAPEEHSNWTNLFQFYILNRAWSSLEELYYSRNQFQNDGHALLFQTLFSQETANNSAAVAALRTYVERQVSHQFDVILNYASASAKLIAGMIDDGRSIFKEIEKSLNLEPSFGLGLPHVKDLGWMANQFITKEETDLVLENAEALKLSTLGWVFQENWTDPHSSERPVIFAGCDVVYFDLFADQFIEVFKNCGHLHIHVVKGDETTLKNHLKKYDSLSISFSFEAYDDLDNSPFYASVRFLRCDEIIERFNRDVIMIDIDIQRTHRFNEFIEMGQKADVTLFRDDTIIPWMHYCAGLIYFKNNELSKMFIHLMKKTMMKKLAGARWFIDQTILNCVVAYIEENNPNLKMCFLGFENNFLHRDIIIQADKSEMENLRRNAGYK